MSRKQFASEYRPEEDFSRRAAKDRYSSQRRRRGQRSRVLVFCLIGLVLLALVVVASVGWGLSVQAGLRAGLPEDLHTALSESPTTEPFYLLVVGVDDGVEELGEDPSSKRADAIVLARVDSPSKKLTLVSIVRDSQVDLGASGKQRVSALYSIGGATYTTRVISQFAGVPVAHYLEIDITQLNTVVDALGGIEVDVPANVTDPQSGANLSAGMQHLNGDAAQQLVRARHGYDNDELAEDYRAASQRQVVMGIFEKLLSGNPLSMLGKIARVNPYLSSDIDLLSLATLASNMRGFSRASNLYMGQNPYDLQEIDGVVWVVTNRTEWREMMLRVGQGLPPYVPGQEPAKLSAQQEGEGPAASGGQAAQTEDTSEVQPPSVPPVYEGSVRILNASDTNGLAASASDVLNNAGFDTGTATASEQSDVSVIIYATPLDEGKARGVCEALGGKIAVRANDGTYSMSTDVLVILGRDQVE